MIRYFPNFIHIKAKNLLFGFMPLQFDFQIEQLVRLFLDLVQFGLLFEFHLLHTDFILNQLTLTVEFFNKVVVLLLFDFSEIEFFKVREIINIFNIVSGHHWTENYFQLLLFIFVV